MHGWKVRTLEAESAWSLFLLFGGHLGMKRRERKEVDEKKKIKEVDGVANRIRKGSQCFHQRNLNVNVQV